MFKKFKMLVLSTMLIGAVGLAGCSANTEEKESKRVTLVLDLGGVNDESFNQSAWTGAEQAAKELGVEVRYLESNKEADYESNIETAIDMGSDLIIGVGFNLTEAIEKAANAYPEQQFAIVDGSFEKIPSNVANIVFNEKEAGYLAGLATAKTIKSDKFGFVGGFEVPAVINYRDGFEKGLKEINPKATLSVQYANSFTDAAKGRAIAEQMTKNGISCIMAAAGGVNNGIYEVCAEKDAHAVAVDMAQSYILPNTILTSAIKKVDVGVAETIKSYVNGSLKSGTASIYNIANNGVGYEETKLISKDVLDFINNKIAK